MSGEGILFITIAYPHAHLRMSFELDRRPIRLGTDDTKVDDVEEDIGRTSYSARCSNEKAPRFSFSQAAASENPYEAVSSDMLYSVDGVHSDVVVLGSAQAEQKSKPERTIANSWITRRRPRRGGSSNNF
jgi:hypothetical protein